MSRKVYQAPCPWRSLMHSPNRPMKQELPRRNRQKTRPTPPESGRRAWVSIQVREARKDVLIM